MSTGNCVYVVSFSVVQDGQTLFLNIIRDEIRVIVEFRFVVSRDEPP